MENPYYDRLLAAALRFVSYRPRSEAEFTDFLQKKLKKWDVAGDLLLEKVKTRMSELGYIDDDAFIAWWISQRLRFRPKGMRIIKQELLKKGFPRDRIEEVISRLTKEDGVSEEEAAKKAVQKKIILWAKLPRIEQKRKLYTFLVQRGFTSGTISRVIDELIQKEYNE